ncbi:hypothetical protein [Streptomyces sp. NPDC007264]|uniref:hypothetical protein n=1 Tax=Streptomyces sp. NPDC007264 TaxID=3364777 RepID=UPI0036DEC2B6
MTSANGSDGSAAVADGMDTLLWRWVDHINRDDPSRIKRPEWFAPAGELVLDEQVTWFGMTTVGGWYHQPWPAGTDKAPVYAGFHWHRQDDAPPVARVSVVVVPLADPARITAADWDDGYGGYEPAPLNDYAVLCSDPYDPGGSADRETHLRAAERVIAAGDAEGRRANYAEIVTDPDRGGNALFFPVAAEERDGFEAVEPDGTIVCLAFTAYDFD